MIFFKDFSVSLHHWSRCDIPFVIGDQTVVPKKCEPYNFDNGHNDDITVFQKALNEALEDIQSNDIDAAFVYYPQIDLKGHVFGPDDDVTKKEVKDADKVIFDFLDTLKNQNLDEIVNVIVVADHGMTKNSNFVSNMDIISSCQVVFKKPMISGPQETL